MVQCKLESLAKWEQSVCGGHTGAALAPKSGVGGGGGGGGGGL